MHREFTQDYPAVYDCSGLGSARKIAEDTAVAIKTGVLAEIEIPVLI